MKMLNLRAIFLTLLLFLIVDMSFAGPPFNTDDPQPVDFNHWEFYISSINTFQPKAWSGTIPHFEVNYGIIPNMQVHLLLPMNYDYNRNAGTHFGYANTEFGLKFRFVQESAGFPQIGVFPIVEIPTIKNPEFSNGNVQVYIPIWLQKSWGKLTTYAGGGYWINPGINNRNWLFSGWEIQYDFSRVFTFGGEIFYHSASAIDLKSGTGFNLGGFVNFSNRFHIIYSVGHSLSGDQFMSSYIGVLWTI